LAVLNDLILALTAPRVEQRDFGPGRIVVDDDVYVMRGRKDGTSFFVVAICSSPAVNPRIDSRPSRAVSSPGDELERPSLLANRTSNREAYRQQRTAVECRWGSTKLPRFDAHGWRVNQGIITSSIEITPLSKDDGVVWLSRTGAGGALGWSDRRAGPVLALPPAGPFACRFGGLGAAASSTGGATSNDDGAVRLS
jgi:hypothetical protein